MHGGGGDGEGGGGEGGGGDGGGGDGGSDDGRGGDSEGGGGDGEGEGDREGEGEGEGEGARACAFAASAVETAIDAEAAAATDGAISAPNGSRPTARALVGQRACAARPREATDGADGRASKAGLSNLYKDRKVHGKVKVMFKDKVVHTACPLLTNLLAVYGCWWMRFGALSEGLRACDFPLIVK